MKKLILFVLIMALATPGFCQSMSVADEKFPLPTSGNPPIISFPVMATPTLTLTGVVAQVMPPLPVGSKGVIVKCTTETVGINYGGTNVLSGSGYAQIASGAQATFIVSPLKQPTIYFFPTATGTSPVLRFTPFK